MSTLSSNAPTDQVDPYQRDSLRKRLDFFCDEFDEAMDKFALAYAVQAERNQSALKATVR
jgi:hypothetical protein